jgi:hypothetical protein
MRIAAADDVLPVEREAEWWAAAAYEGDDAVLSYPIRDTGQVRRASLSWQPWTPCSKSILAGNHAC